MSEVFILQNKFHPGRHFGFQPGVSNMFSVTLDYIRNQPQHFKRKAEVAADERDITDHIVIVTGANHGIGWQTALELARRDAYVVMACRDLKKAEAAKELILREVPQGKLEIIRLDLGDSKTVHKFSDVIHKKFCHIDMLINNAGIYKFKGIEVTKDGFEQHMGVNHLNPFLLTLLLLDLLKKAKKSRIVNISSMINQLGDIDPDNLNLEGAKLQSRFTPYANSKLANILFTRELARRLGEDSNITVYALCPGMVNAERPEEQGYLMRILTSVMTFCIGLLDLKNGALCTLHCALSKSLESETGKMYRLLDVWNLPADEKLAEQVWEKSEELVGLKFQKP